MPKIHRLQMEPIILKALEEDWGLGDWTTDICVPQDKISSAQIIAKEATIVAGLEIVETVFSIVDPSIAISLQCENGNLLQPGTQVLTVNGNARSILKAERVALNFLGRLSGIAQSTRNFVQKLEPFATQLLDTRKTTPGLRLFEKAATSIGGARNHRLCLTDGVLVKENHIRAAGGITKAINRLSESLPPLLKIEVETTNINEVHEAVDAGADLIMLDNMSESEMKMAVKIIRKRALSEASGNITLENISKVAQTGVDFISTSAMLHSSRWSDFSLLFNHS